MPQSSDKNPTPEPSNRQEEAATTTATAHLTSRKRPHPWPPSATPWGTSVQTKAASAATDGKTEGLNAQPRRPPGWGTRHHHGHHLQSHGTRQPQRQNRCRMMAGKRGRRPSQPHHHRPAVARTTHAGTSLPSATLASESDPHTPAAAETAAHRGQGGADLPPGQETKATPSDLGAKQIEAAPPPHNVILLLCSI
jgi:hypothetical protein